MFKFLRPSQRGCLLSQAEIYTQGKTWAGKCCQGDAKIAVFGNFNVLYNIPIQFMVYRGKNKKSIF